MKNQKKRPAARPGRLSDALVCKALNAAAQDAIELHRRAGLPLAVWQDGKVVLVPADEISPQRNGRTPRRRKSPRKRSRE